MKFEEIEIGKKYVFRDIFQKGEILYVAEILDEHFNKTEMQSYLWMKPVFWIHGYGGLGERSISYNQFQILYKEVKEVNWNSTKDCPEYYL